MNRYIYLSMFMTFGLFVIAIFAVIFLGYTNSFLMKRRRKELGLYNVLGMGKRNIARMLGMETVYTALIGIGGGILAGLLLQKLVTLLLCRIMACLLYTSMGTGRPRTRRSSSGRACRCCSSPRRSPSSISCSS